MATVIKATSLLQRQARWAWLASLGSLATAMLSILLVWQWRPKELWVYAVPFLLLNAAGVVGNWCLIYIRGYLGERRVFGALRKLPDEYALLNDVNLSVGVKQAQIDHVVVSPYGVWCVRPSPTGG